MTTKNASIQSDHRQFVLLVPPVNPGERSVLQAIPVPEGPSFLVTGNSRPPRLVTRKPARAQTLVCLEPVVVHRRSYLLMLQAGEAALRRGARQGVRQRDAQDAGQNAAQNAGQNAAQDAGQNAAQGAAPGVRQNGQRAWPLSLLRVKDELRIDDHAVYVSSRCGPRVFPPEPGHVGVPCPLCTVAIIENTLVFACGSCGTLLHCEDERWPADERLECARLATTCPNCCQAIDFKEGLEWEPEL